MMTIAYICVGAIGLVGAGYVAWLVIDHFNNESQIG